MLATLTNNLHRVRLELACFTYTSCEVRSIAFTNDIEVVDIDYFLFCFVCVNGEVGIFYLFHGVQLRAWLFCILFGHYIAIYICDSGILYGILRYVSVRT